jgi:DNA polymerase (family 10)
MPRTAQNRQARHRSKAQTRARPPRARPAPAGRKTKSVPRRTPSKPTAIRALADVIGRGDEGRRLAAKLCAQGAKKPADLRKQKFLSQLPRDSRATVVWRPAKALKRETADQISSLLQASLGFCRQETTECARYRVLPVGSIRRRRPTHKDLDFLVVVPSVAAAEHAALRLLSVPRTKAAVVDTYLRGPRRRSMVLAYRAPETKKAKHYRVDLFFTTAKELPFALFHYTGSKQYNIRTRAHAKRKGWRLNQYGLFGAASGQKAAPVKGSSSIKSEEDLARFIGVSYREPTNRER